MKLLHILEKVDIDYMILGIKFKDPLGITEISLHQFNVWNECGLALR